MSENHYYFALQYSAIQETVLRHDRLWSIAGISQILSRMNEIELPAIVEHRDIGEEVLVAGGGKFTARFLEKVHRVAITSRTDVINKEDLGIFDYLSEGQSPIVPELKEGFSLPGYLMSVRAEIISRALDASGGDTEKATNMIGIPVQEVFNIKPGK
jgi:hypothetical protein